MKSGAVGAVAEYEARFDRFRLESKPNAWRERADHPAAGVLWDLGPHLIDQALVLFGEPETIWASAFCQRQDSKIDDSFDVHMEYPRLRATLRARIIAYAPGPHLLIHGTEGSFVKYGMDPQEEILRSENCPDGPDWGADWGEETEERWGTLSRVGGETRKVKDRTWRLSRVLRQCERCDREGISVGCDAGAGAAHHARSVAGA